MYENNVEYIILYCITVFISYFEIFAIIGFVELIV